MIDADKIIASINSLMNGETPAPGTRHILQGLTHEQLADVRDFISSFDGETADCGDPDNTCGWIPWDGGKCPLSDDTLVDVKLNGGDAIIRRERCDKLTWDHIYTYSNIIAYRVVK